MVPLLHRCRKANRRRSTLQARGDSSVLNDVPEDAWVASAPWGMLLLYAACPKQL